MKKRISPSTIVSAVAVSWIVYSMLVLSSGKCEYYIEERNGSWYVLEEEEQYEVDYFGSLSKDEAEKIISECEHESNQWMDKYGTVYRLPMGSKWENELNMVVFLIPIGVIGFIYKST